MSSIWTFSAAAGTYTSPIMNPTSTTGEDYFSNQINFAFYNDSSGTVLSVNPLGSLVVTGRSVPNAVFQSIPSGTIDVANPISLNWNGVANQLQVVIATSLVNTNFVRITFNRG